MYENSTINDRGTTPAGSAARNSFAVQDVPIVKVFPEPVCPYARMVELKPWQKRSTTGKTMDANLYGNGQDGNLEV